MKKFTTLFLSLFAINAFACPCPDLYKEPEHKVQIENKDSIYTTFTKSNNKRKFLENQINNYPEINTIIDQESCQISKYKRLRENSAILFLQISCKQSNENIHVILPKVDVIDVKISKCSVANKKYNDYVGCREKI